MLFSFFVVSFLCFSYTCVIVVAFVVLLGFYISYFLLCCCLFDPVCSVWLGSSPLTLYAWPPLLTLVQPLFYRECGMPTPLPSWPTGLYGLFGFGCMLGWAGSGDWSPHPAVF